MTAKADRPKAQPLEDWANLAAVAAQAAASKGRDVIFFEVGPVLTITEAFILATGTTARQVRTIAEAVEEAVKAAGGRGPRIEGLDDARWVLLDFGAFVVHVFQEEARAFYALEKLWLDAPRVDWESRKVLVQQA
jgi:ribosome-associated protein